MYGFDYSPLKEVALREPLVDTVDVQAVVTEPALALTLDLYKCQVSDLAFKSQVNLSVRRDDFIHAIVGWFDIEFTAAHKTVRFSTGPHTKWTHWKQTVFYLHDVLTVQQGESVDLTLHVKPSEKNRRDLDIAIDYKFPSADVNRAASGSCTYKMC